MYNPMLDRPPEDYKGWLIRTDFRIGVQIQLCLSDPALSEQERLAVALGLLYGNGVPELQTALDGLSWFMSCGTENTPDSSAGPEVYSFELDAGRIVSAFRKVFGLDLCRERLHWFLFVSMLGDLDNTAFTSVIEIRRTPEGEVAQQRRAEFRRMKRRFSLHGQYSEEEKEHLDSIIRQAKA